MLRTSLLLLTAGMVCALEAADSVVVCHPSFHNALQPWVRHRESQGHRLHFLSNRQTAKQIRGRIQELHRNSKLRSVVLVGDAPQAGMTQQQLELTVPTHHIDGKVNIFFGSEKTIASDNYFADLDGDQIPEIAVGRLTADNSVQLSAMVKKILAYEMKTPGLNWRNKIHMVAGVGGFGGIIDGALESVTKKFLADGVPNEYRMSITFASWRSPFCPDPRHFHQTTLDLLNDGCLFFVYTGHGQRRYLDRVRVPGDTYPILERRDASRLRCQAGHPIAIFLACYTGAYDFSEDCLAEELLRAPGGPVAIYAGSRVTMPYAMGVMANGLMDEYFHQRRETLGEILLNSKLQMIRPNEKAHRITREHRLLADTIARLVSPKPKLLREERLEHLWLYNLMGDPLLRVPQPKEAKLTVAGDLRPGETVQIKGKSDISGTAVLQLVSPRDKNKHALPKRRLFDNSDQALAEYQQVYRKANDRLWLQQQFPVKDGTFQARLKLPTDITEQAVFRVVVHHPSGEYALGSTEVAIERKAADSTSR